MSAWIKTAVQPRLTFPTLTGSIVTFNSQYALPLKSHTVDIDSVSGVSAINIMATGKNFAPINAHSQTASGTIITVDTDGIATVENTGTGSHFFEYYRGNFNFPKGTYRLTAWVNGEEYTQSSTPNSSYRIYFSMTNGGQVNAGNSFTVNQDTGLWLIYIQTRNGYTYDDEVKIQIELGTVKTEWQKFGKLVNIPIGSTVNEGEYDARTGILEVTSPTVQTIQLPPCPIDTLEGVNNIWADTGDTTLQYPKFG